MTGTMRDRTIAFIGCGNMGRSLMGGLIAGGQPPAALKAADPDAAQRGRTAELFGIDTCADNAAAAQGADVVVLAVKPQAMEATARSLAPALASRPALILSVAAGIRLGTLARWLGADLPIVRAMPNTPALKGLGACGLCANRHVDADGRALAAAIAGAVGIAEWFEDEADLDVVTALSGSGPAYFFLLMEALEDAAVELGLDAVQARRLTIQTALGAAAMAQDEAGGPAALRRQVTSPGGTTERALAVLENGGFAALAAEAVRAARQRADELGRAGDDA